MLEFLTDLVSGSPWTYALVLGIAALDALFPIVPSETTAIAAGVLAGAGELSLALVIAAATAGAFAGDTSTYALGRVTGERAARRLPARRLDWAGRMLETRGGYLIVGSRFIPGGRTVTMLSAGLTRMPSRRFLRLAALAAVVWGSYVGLLGYVGGRTFEERPWQGLVLALGLAGGIAVAVELGRRLRHRRRSS
jgi:membrane protein DedA with SNARE-associated domain